MSSRVKLAYPDFDDVLPQIDGFRDTSKANELAPSLTSDELGLMFFVDYKDRRRSKYPELPRFTFLEKSAGGYLAKNGVFETNNLDEALDFIESYRADRNSSPRM